MNHRENLIKAWRFQNPESIPITVGLTWLNWGQHGYDLQQFDSIISSHKILFPNYKKGDIYNNSAPLKDRPDMVKGNKYTDGWGCVWETVCNGMVGTVTHHPLADWLAFDTFQPPDPAKHDGLLEIDWQKLKKDRAQASLNNEFFALGIPRGHTLLRAQDLRGYENLIFDMADDKPEFVKLLAMIETFNVSLIKRFAELKPDAIMIPEDLGMQTTPMVSPAMFKKYFKPIYKNMTAPIKQKGIIVHEHSDGFIIPLIDDLVECGGDVINLQDLVNGIDELEKNVKGRMAIDLDIDRQSVTVNGSEKDIDDLIHQEVEKLSSPEGGLSLIYQPWPPTLLKNMDAVFTAMEKYSKYHQK